MWGQNRYPSVSVVAILTVILFQVKDLHGQPARQRGTMAQAQGKAAALLRLPDIEYFTLDEKHLLRLQTQLGDMFYPQDAPPRATPASQPISLVALGAPKTVALAKDSLPVLVALRQTGQRAWEVDAKQNVKIVAVDMATGATYVGRPRVGRKHKRYQTPPPSMSGNPPDDLNARTIQSGVTRYDLRLDEFVPWRPSRLALTVVVFDWVSNTVVVELVDRSSSAASTATDSARREAPRILASSIATRVTPNISPNISPNVSPEQGGAGAALEVPAQVVSGGAIEVLGTIDLPAERVIGDKTKSGNSVITALLLLKKDEPFPPYVCVAVPVETYQHPDKNSPYVKASFQFDLNSGLSDVVLLGQYQIHFFVGDTAVGPYPLSVRPAQ